MERTIIEPAAQPNDTARADPRAARLRASRDDLVPRIRRACPSLPDFLFDELIEEMALTRLREEERNW